VPSTISMRVNRFCKYPTCSAGILDVPKKSAGDHVAKLSRICTSPVQESVLNSCKEKE
jgi:hypothetical protein